MNFKKIAIAVFVSASCSLIVHSCTHSVNAESITNTRVDEDASVHQVDTQVIQWNTLENIEDKMITNPKNVIVDVYTDWCKWCKVMDNQTFSDPTVIEYLNENYHMVKFNAEQKSKVKFNGQEYNYVQKGRRGYNEIAAKLLGGKLSFPSLVVLDTELQSLTVIPGFQSPEKLLQKLNKLEI